MGECKWLKEALIKLLLLPVILIEIIFTTCTNGDNRDEILTAKFTLEESETIECVFRMYSDSSYIFDVHEYQKMMHEKNEVFRGYCILKGDSIVFYPNDFRFISAETAIIKNDYLEFIGGNKPFKMKILNRENSIYTGIDTVKYRNYSFFTYDSAFYYQFSKDVTPYDLTNEDLVKVEEILASCIKDGNFKLTDYFRQCIAVKNKNNEREVWLNLHCSPEDIESLKYFIVEVYDGGDCYMNLKINLDKNKCFNVMVNGNA